ncbi:hypothetical protein LXA43DRAFT_601610 [Ganoderma leucocontextum]|nr:hypothetical protein LXA43DRAFT_601610 [Ganoderma leucocontextum]
MPLSVGGGQLPLSAFFGSPGSSVKRSTKSKVASKRKESPIRGQAAEPPKKKRKQKENVTPSSYQSLQNATPQSEGTSGSSKARRRHSSSTEMDVDEVDALVGLPDGVGANIYAGDVLIDLTVDGSDDIIPSSAHKHARSLKTPPPSPEVQDRRRDSSSITSLPSPPLTAPDARARKKRDDGENKQEDVLELPQVDSIDRGTRPGPPDVKNIETDTVPRSGSPPQAHAVEHNVPCSPRSSQSSRDLMPPPPLPLKALLPSSRPLSATVPTPLMPRPAQLHRPRSVSSEKWVPSSQTQELSIPRYEDMQDDQSSDEVRPTRRGRASQVVPSSQLSEKELEVLHGTSDHRDAQGPASSAVLADGPDDSASSYPPAASPAAGGEPEESTSHEIVESSQSQIETEITATWADILAARRETLRWSKKSNSSLPSSSPPRAVETQDYDAQSEWSSSIDEVSQSLTMDPRTSPLQPPSQLPSAESSGSYEDSESMSYSVLPSQVRRFLETFEGRDENGNELSRDAGAGVAQSRSSSPTQDRGRSLGRRGRQASLGPPESQGKNCDAITASPLTIPEDYGSDSGSCYGSSFPSTMPTPLRNFLEMFPDTQTQDQPEVEPSQRRDDDTYDF